MLLEEPKHRRREDWAARMIAAVPPTTGDGLRSHPMRVTLPGRTDPLMLVVAGNRETDGREVQRPASPEPRPEVAISEVQQILMRVWRRRDLPEKLLEFFARLSDAESADVVCQVVAASALEMVGGFDASVLLVSSDADHEQDVLMTSSRFARPGIMMASELSGAVGSTPGGLSMTDQVCHVAHVPLGTAGILFLAERRSDRIFEPHEWEILVAIARQGERALRRVKAMEAAQELSLYDPLTGLANRRLMELALRQAWSGAQRGEGMALIMIDLDNFKEINDTFGHRMGDEVLKVVGETLRSEARGVDVVVRYGGDEFLVIMPRSNGAGANALTKRLARRLAGWVEFTAGIACYSPAHSDVTQMIEAADRALYAERVGRGRGRLAAAVEAQSSAS